MIREVRNGHWERRRLALRPLRFSAGRYTADAWITRQRHAAWAAQQRVAAVAVMTDGDRTYWWCMDRFWSETEGLAASDVHALVFERERRKARKIAHAHAVVAGTESVCRAPVPREVRGVVFERDGGACVDCGATFDLQFDHVIPVAMGGASTPENLQLLCAPCNRVKGATLG